MQYVILAEHSADLCPTSNAKVRKKLEAMAGQIGGLLAKHKMKIASGPHILGMTHKMVVVVDAASVEVVRDFCMASGLIQTNSIDIHPSWTMEEALKRSAALTPIPW